MSQKLCHSSQSQSFPFPPQDQSKLPLPRALCLFPRYPGDLLSQPCALFLLSQQIFHPTPAVLEGKEVDFPAQMVALGQRVVPHAGGSLARPELTGKPHSVAAGDPQGSVSMGVPLFFRPPPAGSSPQAGRVSLKLGVPSSLPFEKKSHFFPLIVNNAEMFDVDIWIG